MEQTNTFTDTSLKEGYILVVVAAVAVVVNITWIRVAVVANYLAILENTIAVPNADYSSVHVGFGVDCHCLQVITW